MTAQQAPTVSRTPVELALRVSDGVVREATVSPLARPVDRGSLADIPFANAAEAPSHVVFSRKWQPRGTWEDVSCATFAAEVLALAKGLIAHGLRPGDRLAIMSRTRYEWTLLDFAAWAAGLVTVPIYPNSAAHQARWILQDAGVTACAVEDVAGTRLISQIRGGLPGLHHLWQFDTGALGQISGSGEHLPDSLVTERRDQLGPHSIATLIYTSGTTGRPKGCVITHGNFFAEVDNAIELLRPVFSPVGREEPATVLFLPLAHVFGRMVAVGCQRARVRLAHAPSVQTDDLLGDLAGVQPTFLLAIPHVLEKVYNTGRATAETMGRAAGFDRAARVARRYGRAAAERQRGVGPGPGVRLRTARGLYDRLVYRRVRAAFGGRLRYVICGGAPLGRPLAAFYEGVGIEVFEGYGLTETTAAATVTPPQRPRLGTVGWPLPGTSVRIADDGEVLLRGGQVFGGYWDAERRTAVSGVDPDGWLATGDVGALDADGYLTITGRTKDLIVTSNGKNVAPAPLEDWLRAHPLVRDCLVIGDRRPYLAALITLEREGLAHWCRMRHKHGVHIEQLVTDGDLLRTVRQAVDEANRLVSRSESIRRFAVLPTDFTEESGHLTPSLKLRRDAITRDFAEEIDALYEED